MRILRMIVEQHSGDTYSFVFNERLLDYYLNQVTFYYNGPQSAQAQNILVEECKL